MTSGAPIDRRATWNARCEARLREPRGSRWARRGTGGGGGGPSAWAARGRARGGAPGMQGSAGLAATLAAGGGLGAHLVVRQPPYAANIRGDTPAPPCSPPTLVLPPLTAQAAKAAMQPERTSPCTGQATHWSGQRPPSKGRPHATSSPPSRGRPHATSSECTRTWPPARRSEPRSAQRSVTRPSLTRSTAPLRTTSGPRSLQRAAWVGRPSQLPLPRRALVRPSAS
jgi:hypothetical protein